MKLLCVTALGLSMLVMPQTPRRSPRAYLCVLELQCEAGRRCALSVLRYFTNAASNV